MIPTAKDFLNDKFKAIYHRRPDIFKSKLPESRYLDLYVSGRIDGTEQNYPEMMIEFAKLHVKAALEAAYKKADLKEEEKGDEQICFSCNDFGDSYVLDKNSILNSYPLENIK